MCGLVGFESSIVDLMFKHGIKRKGQKIYRETRIYPDRQTQTTDRNCRQTNKKIG